MSVEEREELVARLRVALDGAPVPSAEEAAADRGAPGGDREMLASILDGAHPADVAEAMEQVSDEEALRIFAALDAARAAETLDELDAETARYLLDHEVPGRIAALLDLLPMDDAAEVLAEAATPERQEEILEDLSRRSPEDAAEVRELLSYPPGSAGRLMTDRFMRLRADLTVDEAFVAIRSADPEVETLNDLYVTEPAPERPGEERLTGILSLRELVRQPGHRRITDFMTTDLVTVQADTDQEEVARLISKYDFLAMPVLDSNGYLAGIITVDDVVDVLVQEQTEDVLRQGAITAEPGVTTQPYFSVPIWTVVRSRLPWLALLFVAEMGTGFMLHSFETELDKVVALAFFMPLLIGTGGNTGAQTVATVIRALTLKDLRGRDTPRVLVRELMSGLLLGALLGCVAFVLALILTKQAMLALVVALAVAAICTWANTMGSLVPLLANRLNIDPALVSAPLITTLVDTTGLLIYFLIAKALLTQLR
jgi:magnesium transporter